MLAHLSVNCGLSEAAIELFTEINLLDIRVL